MGTEAAILAPPPSGTETVSLGGNSQAWEPTVPTLEPSPTQSPSPARLRWTRPPWGGHRRSASRLLALLMSGRLAAFKNASLQCGDKTPPAPPWGFRGPARAGSGGSSGDRGSARDPGPRCPGLLSLTALSATERVWGPTPCSAGIWGFFQPPRTSGGIFPCSVQGLGCGSGALG